MKQVTKSFYLLTFGVLMNISAYVGLLTLQSSLNIKHSIGTTSASILFITAAFISLFVAPILILRAGMKWSLIIGEVGLLFYTLANLYPKLEIMVFGALLGAFGEALIWSSSPVYINFLLRKYWETQEEFDSSVTEEMIRNKWIAKYLVILKFCMIFGNILSYAALYGGRNIGHDFNNASSAFHDLSLCGARFHVEKVKNGSDFHKFVPRNKLSVYLLLAFYLVLQILSVVIHGFFLPRLKQFNNETQNVWKIVSGTIVSTFNHVTSRNHLLLTPLYLYYGLLVSYNMGVFSRAFLSCSLGVQLVGLGMTIQGSANILMTILAGKLSYHYGIAPIAIIAFFFELGVYAVQLNWIFNYNTRYYIFILSACSGIADGTWQLSLFCLTARYFSERQEIAYSVEALWTVLGMFVGFTLASTIAVNTHIYIIMSMLTIGCLGFGTIEYIRRRENDHIGESISLIQNNLLNNDMPKELDDKKTTRTKEPDQNESDSKFETTIS